MARRTKARNSVIGFARYTMPAYRAAAMHRLICEKLEAVERGEIRRLMIFTPPRHGKSELVSRRFPAWYLGRRPERQFISASYGADLAADFGRDVRNILASPEFAALFPGIGLAADSASKARWHTNLGGSYVAAGVGTAITGRGADILNIDDPVKDRVEAESSTTRESVWSWYTSTAYTRLMPGGCVILTMTRWHEDDLAGRLISEMANGGDQWEILDLPALALNLDDALGRQKGEAVWPERYDAQALDGIRLAIGERDFGALYQQRPRPADGALFHTGMVTILDAAPALVSRVRAWDFAATAQTGTRDPDWTVGLEMGKLADGRYIILDVVRLRGGPDEVNAALKATASRDGRGVPISIPQDPGAAGKAQAAYQMKELAGYTVHVSPETGDKSTRAAPAASQCNVGNLLMLRAPWNRTLLDEMAGFPASAKDDQIDSLSRAFGHLSLARNPMRINPGALANLMAARPR